MTTTQTSTATRTQGPAPTPTTTQAALDAALAHELAVRSLRLMEQWDDAEAQALIAPSMVNAEAVSEPPAARVPGPAGTKGTYDWLHAAYADLRWQVDDVVAEGEWVVARVTMSGRQRGPFVTYRPDGQVDSVFPSRGRSFAVAQTHWYRLAGTQVVEHLANRDDLGQALQLGWLPPTPLFLLRAALLARRLRRAAR